MINKIFALRGQHLKDSDINDIGAPILIVTPARNNCVLMIGDGKYVLIDHVLIVGGVPIFTGFSDPNDEELKERIETFNMYYNTHFKDWDVIFINKFSETVT